HPRYGRFPGRCKLVSGEARSALDRKIAGGDPGELIQFEPQLPRPASGIVQGQRTIAIEWRYPKLQSIGSVTIPRLYFIVTKRRFKHYSRSDFHHLSGGGSHEGAPPR